MAPLNPVLIDLPMPIRTPRLLIRPKQVGDGALTSAAVAETWEELHKWTRWAENRDDFTVEQMEIRNRHVMASFILRQDIELTGIETATGTPVAWWGSVISTGKVANAIRGIGFARAPRAKASQLRGQTPWCIMPSVLWECSELVSRIQPAMRRADALRRASASHLKGSRKLRRYSPLEADRYCYARFDLTGLPSLEVQWQSESR
jgi:hypothetical protein